MNVRRAVVSLAIAVVVVGLAGCVPARPTPTPIPTQAIAPATSATEAATPALHPTAAAGTPVVPGSSIRRVPQPGDPALLAEMLEYMPNYLAEVRPTDLYGYVIHYVDVARIREELGVGAISSADELSAKVGLIAGLKIQGLKLGPFDPTEPSAYDQWGWDVADIDQSLYLPFDRVAILAGRFDATLVTEKLEGEGYTGSSYGATTIYTAEGKEWSFGVSPDVLLIAADTQDMRVCVDQKQIPEGSMAALPNMLALLQEAQPMWGALLLTSSDLHGLRELFAEQWDQFPANERRAYLEFVDPNGDDTCEYLWDLALLTFRNPRQQPEQRYLYHFATERQADEHASALVNQLARVHSIRNLASTWAEILVPQRSEAHGEVLVFEATTMHETMLGLALEVSDVGFLPIQCSGQ